MFYDAPNTQSYIQIGRQAIENTFSNADNIMKDLPGPVDVAIGINFNGTLGKIYIENYYVSSFEMMY